LSYGGARRTEVNVRGRSRSVPSDQGLRSCRVTPDERILPRRTASLQSGRRSHSEAVGAPWARQGVSSVTQAPTEDVAPDKPLG